MKSCVRPELAITGIGVVAASGQGRAAFTEGLLAGGQAFGVMQRPGRQKNSAFLGAELPELRFPDGLSRRALRGTSLSGQAALVALHEAWYDAYLDDVEPDRIGLVIGGSNLQQRELVLLQELYAERPQYLRPTYGVSFMDTDLCGLCTEAFPIRGFALSVGGASASGHVALLQAAQAVLSGRVDVCIALGGLMDLSYWECQGLRSLGAMGSDRFAQEPELACRPFDRDHDGFIFGECCGAVVVERVSGSRSRVEPYAQLAGWATVMDGNRNPNPSLDGEIRVIGAALKDARFTAADIDYVNPHGTGSVLGDATELQALAHCGLAGAPINATKSVIGHGLSAAGLVEVIATLVQMEQGRLHPTRNLDAPIEPGFNWVRERAAAWKIDCALNLSLGFGGINTALCLRNLQR